VWHCAAEVSADDGLQLVSATHPVPSQYHSQVMDCELYKVRIILLHKVTLSIGRSSFANVLTKASDFVALTQSYLCFRN
jgi:hypothetical protein